MGLKFDNEAGIVTTDDGSAPVDISSWPIKFSSATDDLIPIWDAAAGETKYTFPQYFGNMPDAIRKRKPGDQSVTNTTTLVTDNDLTMSLDSGRYRFQMFLRVFTTSSLGPPNAGFRFRLDYSGVSANNALGEYRWTNSTNSAQGYGNFVPDFSVVTGIDVVESGSSSSVTCVAASGSFQAFGAGTFALQFAQNVATSSVFTTVGFESYLFCQIMG